MLLAAHEVSTDRQFTLEKFKKSLPNSVIYLYRTVRFLRNYFLNFYHFSLPSVLVNITNQVYLLLSLVSTFNIPKYIIYQSILFKFYKEIHPQCLLLVIWNIKLLLTSSWVSLQKFPYYLLWHFRNPIAKTCLPTILQFTNIWSTLIYYTCTELIHSIDCRDKTHTFYA